MNHPGPKSHAEQIRAAVLRAAAEANQILTPEFLERLDLQAKSVADEITRDRKAQHMRKKRAEKRAG